MSRDSESDGLEVLLPVVARWFRATYGAPTPPQRQGWPAIASGKNTLILAPTGSGKTLAAFLACLDHLWRTKPADRPRGVRVLYVSPLKALNADIARNLEFPLKGILEAAHAEGVPLEPLAAAVRSGDTSSSDRQRLVRKPPDILITTPESLHLMLTSRARETLRSVTHVIVDEIHALCSNKRGVFLALLLERLEALSRQSFVRVGLSATQRPLEEVARYLGGSRAIADGAGTRFEPRPVTVIDAGQRKGLDLEVISPWGDPAVAASRSVWPAIEDRLLGLIKEHRSTIVFANNRRVAERLTARLNERVDEGRDGRDLEIELARSHHGSLSPEERRGTEEALKRGELAAVVATASLELGIDMGAVDLVCQVESPGSVARGLQRVGRAGHLVGRTSKGRLIAKTPGDLLESAALCRKMALGEVEALRVPTNCLDVLAQQVVACVAMEPWEVGPLFDLVRRAYPYRTLTAAAFESVLMMISGRFPVESFRDLRARVGWDRIHNRLAALPGTARLALLGGGTIPDTGHYPVHLGEGGPRLGELDEEFVIERRVGETFVLGTTSWRIEAIEPLRVVVARAAGQSALTPFWRGEASGRTAELGEAVGAVARELVARRDDPSALEWLTSECRLEPKAAKALRDHVARQVRVSGVAPDDRTVLVETFRDPAGEMGLAVLTPFGGKLHHALELILRARFRERLGLTVSSLRDDDGILFRLPQVDEPPLDVFAGVTADRAEEMVRDELGDSAHFGLRFRQNAGRALLMPRPDPTKRTPLWLQRLRAKDLLQVVRKYPDFPIVVETYRECLDDDLDLARLRSFLDAINSGAIRVVIRRGEAPSPFVAELIFRFERQFLYEWDDPKSAKGTIAGLAPSVDADLLQPLLSGAGHARLLDPSAIARVESRLRGFGRPPRTTEEMAETLRRLGDLTPSELEGPMRGFLDELEHEGRALTLTLEGTREPARWISAEEFALYEEAFTDRQTKGVDTITRRYLSTRALIGLDDLTGRYPIGPAAATELLERFVEDRRVVRLEPSDEADGPRWADPANLADVRRLSIALERRECVSVAPEVFADFVQQRHGVQRESRGQGSEAVARVLERLQGFAATAEVWETAIFPARLADYRPSWLDDALATGDWIWRAEADGQGPPRVAFFARSFPLGRVANVDAPPISAAGERILDSLTRRGASFAADLAMHSGLEPSRARAALDELMRRGLVTNDRFDPVRRGADAVGEALAEVSARALTRRPSLRRPASARLEGRWSLFGATEGPDDAALEAWAAVLLDRYGVVSREMIAAEPSAPAWSDLVTFLSRAELRGDVRRGYFVEGLSGVQFASHEAAEALARHGAGEAVSRTPIILSTLDPANLYGSGAPFDVDLLEGGTARLPRSPGNDVVSSGGRPVLIIEANGKRLTGLASASESELEAAAALVPTLIRGTRKVLKVATYNGVATLESRAAPWLAASGFVRDHPGMAYYGGW